MIRVKICCIASIEEARIAIEAGASALGLVSAMPSGPGPIPEETIADIVRGVPPGVATFLLTCATDAETIIAQQRRTGASVLQLVDSVPPSVYPLMRAALPGVKIVQVIHVRDADALREAHEAAPFVDAILLDSGNPGLPTKELGGTGRVHDWQVSRRIREEAGVPIYLAGGLRPENVSEAVSLVRPFGVDVCSGLRTEGRLDPEKVGRFFTKLNSLS